MYHVNLIYREGAQVDGAELHRLAEEANTAGVGALFADKFVARAGDSTGILFLQEQDATQFKDRVDGLDYIVNTTVTPVDVK